MNVTDLHLFVALVFVSIQRPLQRSSGLPSRYSRIRRPCPGSCLWPMAIPYISHVLMGVCSAAVPLFQGGGVCLLP